MTLRDYQRDVKAAVYTAWAEPNVYNVMSVLPTGAGKTVVFTDILAEYQQPACVIAHRGELVAQAALALNRAQVPHGIIAPKALVKQIIQLENDMQGYSCYRYNAAVRAAGVDTLRNYDKKDRWLHQVALTVVDEGHHVVNNKWADALRLFPNSRALLPTAHAVRADGKGLGRHASGVVDRLIVGPSCRELINRGFLTDYRLICAHSDIDFSQVGIGPSGEYNLKKLAEATHASNRIVGDVVRHYLRFAGGKLGVTFAVDIEEAGKLAAAYRAANVRAEVITANTPLHVRGQFMRQFRARDILQLVSVDCLGEGVDVPAIEVVSMVRKTASFQLYAQQFGRSLRTMVSDEHAAVWDAYTDQQRLAIIAQSQKPKAIIIDHVDNWKFHGLPDRPREYTLNNREKRQRASGLDFALRSCVECYQPYEAFLSECPYCGASKPPPGGRGSPELVEGDLLELDPAILMQLRGEVARVDGPPPTVAGSAPVIANSILKNHKVRQESQAVLRRSMALWGGWQERTLSTRDAQTKFYHAFGTDYLTAQTLGTTDALALNQRIQTELTKANVIEAS